MSILLQKLKPIARWTLTGLLFIGMIFITGFLSFTGMLVLNSSIYCAIGAFFLAGGIEGEVYAQNINASLKKIFSTTYWEDAIVNNALTKLIMQNYNANPFLLDHEELQDKIETLEREHNHSKDKNNLLKRLEIKKEQFKAFIFGFKDKIHYNNLRSAISDQLRYDNKPYDTDAVDNEIERIRSEIRRKKSLSQLAWILNLAAWTSCTFVGVEVIHASLSMIVIHFGLAISAAALSTSIFGLAVIGATGYMLLIHNTITDMIKNDTLEEWARNIRHYATRRQNETGPKHALRVIPVFLGTTIIVGLAIFATAATAGTWWFVAKAGAKHFPSIARFMNAPAAIAVSLMSITQLIFNTVNSLQSMKEIAKKSVSQRIERAKMKFRKYQEAENKVQLANPFRFIIHLISLPFKAIVFIGHLLSMGIMGDKLNGIHPLATALLSTHNEFFQDLHYIFPEEPHKEINHSFFPKNGIIFADSLAKDNKIRNTFIITTDKNEFIYCNNQGDTQVIFNKAELNDIIKTTHLPLYYKQNHNVIKMDNEEIDTLNKLINKKINPRQNDHNHSHQADIIGRLLKLGLMPLYFLAAIWDFSFSHLNKKKNHAQTNKEEAKERLTIKEALKKSITDQWDTAKPIRTFSWSPHSLFHRYSPAIIPIKSPPPPPTGPSYKLC